MRKIAMILASIFVLVSIVFTQHVDTQRVRDPFSYVYTSGSEGFIEDPSFYGIDEHDSGISACGEYFLYLKGDRLHFDRIFIAVKIKGLPPSEPPIMGIWETNSLRLRILENFDPPKIKIRRGGEITHALGEINISTLKLEDAPCLAKLKTVS